MAAEAEMNAEQLLEGFDPLNDPQDRRILFEVTGMRIYESEFHDEETSDSEGESREVAQPFDYAFMHRESIFVKGEKSNVLLKSINTWAREEPFEDCTLCKLGKNHLKPHLLWKHTKFTP